MKSTLHKIGRKFGKRACERFSIPGATISWVYRGQGTFPEEDTPLSDISRNGLSFLTNDPPEVDSTIHARLQFPKDPGQLELFGRTVYSIFRGPGLTYEYRIGVELSPFSQEEKDNTLESQKVIEQLEETYGKRLETQDI